MQTKVTVAKLELTHCRQQMISEVYPELACMQTSEE